MTKILKGFGAIGFQIVFLALMSKNIRIVSPAKAISTNLIYRAAELLTKKGHIVSIGEYASGQHHYFSGTKQERLADFQDAINDKTIDIILCARGGYGCIHIIDDLDFSPLKKYQKKIIGFSDITVFHIHCHTLNMETIHATMPLNFLDNTNESIQSLLNAIDGQSNSYSIDCSENNILGKAEAKIIGGNLAIIHSLIGTNSDCDFDGKILFIEDVGEYVYTMDRMLWALEKSNKLKFLAGLIIGGMTDIKDTKMPFGNSVEELILDRVSKYNYPVCFNFPAGHIADNHALSFGKKSSLEVTANRVTLKN